MRLIDLFEFSYLAEEFVPLPQGHRAVKDLRVESVVKMAQKGTVRGLVQGRNIWWWPAQAGTHGDVAQQLGYPDYVNHRLMIRKVDNELRVEGEPLEAETWLTHVRKCPQLKNLAQSDHLHFYSGSQGWLSGPEFMQLVSQDTMHEAWSTKYKQSINCDRPKGFSQRAHCAGRKARQAHKQTQSKSVNEMDSQPELLQSFGVPTRGPLFMPYVKFNKPHNS